MQQRYINDGVVIVQLLISQDEATCDGNGRKKLCPVYATFGNIRAAERDFEWARVHDDPESKKVTAVKDKYTEMPMFCIRCAGDTALAA